MKKPLILLIVLAAVAIAIWYVAVGRSGTSANNLSLGMAIVEIGTLESVVTAQGALEPKEYVDVGAQVSGVVEDLHVEIGDSVKAGDLIAEIDSDVYEAQVKSSEAELKVLEAQKSEQQSLVRQAQQKYTRNKNLLKDRAISQEAYQDTETALSVAKAKLVSLDAQIEKAQSSLEANKTNLNYTKIYSPMDGTVVSQSVKEGQTINANQTAPVIVQVANLSVMTAKAQVAEADISKLSVDMPVYFTTLGSRDRRWSGRVRQILPTPENINDVVLYNVLVDAENEDGRLMTDMTAQMFFVLGIAEDVPLIPAAALQKRVPQQDTPDGQAYEVQVPAAKGSETRTVVIGLSDRSKAQVISGLNVGEQVVLPSSASPQANNMRRMGRL